MPNDSCQKTNDKMNIYKKILFLALVLAAAASCRSQFDMILNSNDVDSKYTAAFDYFNRGKFEKASKLCESLTVQAKGFPKVDTV